MTCMTICLSRGWKLTHTSHAQTHLAPCRHRYGQNSWQLMAVKVMLDFMCFQVTSGKHQARQHTHLYVRFWLNPPEISSAHSSLCTFLTESSRNQAKRTLCSMRRTCYSVWPTCLQPALTPRGLHCAGDCCWWPSTPTYRVRGTTDHCSRFSMVTEWTAGKTFD